MPAMRRFAFALLALVFLLPGALAGAQSYTSIVIFGDSLCDTGNDAYVSATTPTALVPVPSPATGYTQGRFTDGTDSSPAARNYYGIWIEQLAAMFPNKPVINYSLNKTTPGQNYAYGFATTGSGTTNFTYGPGSALSFNVNNMATQVASYLATNPTISSKTLFVVWGGANDLIAATTSQDIQNAAMRDAGLVQTLINAGATDFIIPNLPPLGLVPRFNGSAATSVPASTAAAGFDQALAAYLGALPAANPSKTLHLYQLDTYTLFSTIVANPSARGFANVTASSSAAVTGVTTVNPDTYLFWDDIHPTTYGHYQLANSAFTLLGSPITTALTLATSNSQPNPGKTFTLTAQLTSTSGIPQGTVNFLEGTTVLGSAYVTGSSSTATASLTTSYANAGTHNISASFVGANGYANSSTTTSTPIQVIAPGFSADFGALSNPLNVVAGGAGTVTLYLASYGGYSGTGTVTCGALPAHFTCGASPATFTFSGANNQVTSTISIGTNAMASLIHPATPFGDGQETILACGLLPGFGLLSLVALRRSRRVLRSVALTCSLFLLAGVASFSLTGCTSAPNNNANPGTYTVPVLVTANGATTTLNLTVVVH